MKEDGKEIEDKNRVVVTEEGKKMVTNNNETKYEREKKSGDRTSTTNATTITAHIPIKFQQRHQ